MKNLNEIKSKLLDMIGRAEVESVFDQLGDILFQEKVSNLTDFVVLKGLYTSLKNQERTGLISPADYRIQFALTMKGLSDFVQNLKEEDVKGKILVVSPTSDAEGKIEAAMLKFYPNSEFEHKSDGVLAGDYDFVVFNDFYWKPAPEQSEAFENLCREYLKSGHYVVFFTASQKQIVNENRSKIHAANSPFALFARLREMSEFLRYIPREIRNS